MRHWLACALCVMPYGAAAEDAESPRRFGLNIRIGATGESAESVLGAVAHVGNRLILRPSLRYLNSTQKRGTPGLEDRHTDGVWGLKLDALVRLRNRGDVGPYAGVSFGYLDPRSSTSHDDEKDDDDPAGVTWMWTGEALAGAQYSIHRKIGVYGEVGLRWTRASQGDITQTDISTFNGGVGVVFYF